MDSITTDNISRQMVAISNANQTPRLPYRRALLLAFPEMAKLSEELAEKRKDLFELHPIKWATFPDGTPDVIIPEAHKLQFREVVLLVSLRHVESWAAQLSVMYALPRYLVKSLTVVLPYFPTGTMERVDFEGQIATAMTLSRMLSATPVTHDGPARFVIFDIHALPTRFYFGDRVLPCLLSALPVLLKTLDEKHKNEPITIAFPDDGAMKRFGTMFQDKYPSIVCAKVRDGEKRILRVKEGDAKDRHVFIIDDLVQSGGTLLECRNLMKSMGAKKVSCFVTHAVFPKDSWKKFLGDKFEHFYITDTVPGVAEAVKGLKPFEVLSIVGELSSFVERHLGSVQARL